MTYRSIPFLRSSSASLALIATIALSACNSPASNTSGQAMLAQAPSLPATLPLAAGPAATPTYAPAVARLPAAPRLDRVRVSDPGSDYAYADNAWDFGDAAFDGPPDYGFDYQGVEPWAWEGYDRSVTFVEPVDDGYRYYYYEPGADQPYYVRDPDYGYGYDNGRLAVIYGNDGSIVPYDDYGVRADYAARYRVRGLALYEASQARQRRAVVAANWAARSAAISAMLARQAEDRARQDAWQAYHERVATRADNHWRAEQERRQADAQRFAAWRGEGFRAAPPPRVIPAAWQQAKWARNDQRYVALTDQRTQENAVRQQRAARAMAQQQERGVLEQPAPLGGERHLLTAPGGAQQAAMARDGAQQARAQMAAQREAARAGMMAQRDAQRGQAEAAQAMRQQQRQAETQARDHANAGRQQQAQAAREAQRAQAQAEHGRAEGQARAQAQAAREAQRAQAQAERGRAEGQARAQAQAAREAQRAQAQAEPGRAEGQARAQAQAAREAQRAQAQAARSQAEGQARAQAQAARDAQRAQAQAARSQAEGQAREQAQAARDAQRAQAQAARQAPAPQPAPGGGGHGGGHGGGGGDGGGHGRHGG